jgi:hypothetical protein
MFYCALARHGLAVHPAVVDRQQSKRRNLSKVTSSPAGTATVAVSASRHRQSGCKLCELQIEH